MIDNLLIKLGACSAAQDWAAGKSFKEILETCPRADWLLWLFERTNPDDRLTLTQAKMCCMNGKRSLRFSYIDNVFIRDGEEEIPLNNNRDLAAYICTRYLPLEKWNIADEV